MLARLKRHQLSRSTAIPAAFTAVQGISFLLFTILIGVLARISIVQAIAKHKPTAASLTTAFAIIAEGLFLTASVCAFVLAWGLLKQKQWALLFTWILEALLLVLCLLVFLNTLNWLFLAEGVLAVVILVCLFVNQSVRRV